MTQIRLDQFNNCTFDRGRTKLTELTWLLLRPLVFCWPLPMNGLRCWVLRRFGATIGQGVVIRAGVRIKFPWKLAVGDHTWIGESAWIDNLAPVRIGAHCCLSQGVYLCTGNHDWSRPSFDLQTASITIEDGAWVAAMARLAPGVTIGEESIVGLAACVTDSVAPRAIVNGNPAVVTGQREIDVGQDGA